MSVVLTPSSSNMGMVAGPGALCVADVAFDCCRGILKTMPTRTFKSMCFILKQVLHVFFLLLALLCFSFHFILSPRVKTSW